MNTDAEASSLTCAALAEQLLEEVQGSTAAEGSPAQKPENRRSSVRSNFACWQLVAEYNDDALPVQQDFQLRLCQDISAGGISFLADERPRSEDLIIALGPIPFVFFHIRFARVVRRMDLEGQPLQIGCKFVKRLPG